MVNHYNEEKIQEAINNCPENHFVVMIFADVEREESLKKGEIVLIPQRGDVEWVFENTINSFRDSFYVSMCIYGVNPYPRICCNRNYELDEIKEIIKGFPGVKTIKEVRYEIIDFKKG